MGLLSHLPSAACVLTHGLRPGTVSTTSQLRFHKRLLPEILISHSSHLQKLRSHPDCRVWPYRPPRSHRGDGGFKRTTLGHAHDRTRSATLLKACKRHAPVQIIICICVQSKKQHNHSISKKNPQGREDHCVCKRLCLRLGRPQHTHTPTRPPAHHLIAPLLQLISRKAYRQTTRCTS